MKRTAIIAVITLAIIGTGFGLARAHGGNGSGRSGYMGYGNHMGGNYGGHMGGNYGGRMMDFASPGYGPKSAPGYGPNNAPCWNTSDSRVDLTEKDAEELIANRVTSGNPNLIVGKVKKTEEGFEVQVVTKKSNSLVDRLMVEKDTGRVYRIFE